MKPFSAVPQRDPARRGVAQRPDLDGGARARRSLAARPAALVPAAALPGPTSSSPSRPSRPSRSALPPLLLPRARHCDLEGPGLCRGVGHGRQRRLDLRRRHRRPPHRRGKGGAGGGFVVVVGVAFAVAFVVAVVDEAGDQEVLRAVGEAKRRQRGRDLKVEKGGGRLREREICFFPVSKKERERVRRNKNLNEGKKKKKKNPLSYVLPPGQRDHQLGVPRPRPGPAPFARGLGGEGRQPQRPQVGHQRGVEERGVGESQEGGRSLGFPFLVLFVVVVAVFRGSLPDDRVAELPVFVFFSSIERVRKERRRFGSCSHPNESLLLLFAGGGGFVDSAACFLPSPLLALLSLSPLVLSLSSPGRT